MPRPSRFVARRGLTLIALAVAVVSPLLTQSGRARAQESPAPIVALRSRMTPARLAAILDASNRQLNYLPGEVLVKFKDGVTLDGQQRALLSVRSQPSASALRWTGHVAVLHDATEPDAHVLASQLRLQPEVAWAEPNYLRQLHRLQPNDPGFTAFQWNLRMLEMPRAWDLSPGGDANLTVAIVDSGITTENFVLQTKTFNGVAIENISVPIGTNPDLSLFRLVSPIDLVSFKEPVVDFDGHGTHVAGTVGEDANNDLAEVGVAYNVRIMPVKVCFGFWDLQFEMAESGQAGTPPVRAGGCPDDAIADGIRYAADNGAKVINLSLGGAGSSRTLREALIYAVSKGAFVAISAGNDFEDGNPIDYPAAYGAEIAGVMSVGAIGPTRARAFYSGTASGTEIAAPGGDSRQGAIAASMIWQSSIFFPDYEPGVVKAPRFDRYLDTPEQGTSMASPHVAGLAALLASQGVTNPAAIEALIKATATDLGAAGRDDDFGFGLIQPRTALRGFGIFTE